MGVETTITCDQCGHDLTYTGNCEDCRLVLGSESLAPWYLKEGKRGGVLTSMAIAPPVDRKYIFCGIGCLAAWLAERHPSALSEYERLMKHRAWLAEQRRARG